MDIADKILRRVNEILDEKPSLSDEEVKEATKFSIDFFKRFNIMPEEIDEDLLFNQVVGKINYQRTIRITDDTTIIVDKESKPWVMERLENKSLAFHDWELYKEHMLDLDRNSFNVLDSSTTLILDKSGNPEDTGPWSRRGLVMGSVQSGKTANYLGLINKASDAGYKIIIILSGIHNLLREQTQERIDAGFGGKVTSGKTQQTEERYVGVGEERRKQENPVFPIPYTTSESDFNKMKQDILPNLNSLKSPVYMVLKKNSKVLEAVSNWAQGNIDEGQRIEEPLLLLDDEADNASINTSTKKNEVTKINASIRTILRLFNRRTYIGYTATPFANIFIDPEESSFNSIISNQPSDEDDLFPANFIVQLDPSSAYCGPEKFFGINADASLVNTLDLDDDGRKDLELMIPFKHKKDFKVTQLAESLKSAIRTFILVKAIRLYRGQIGQNHSMLINVTFYVGIHQDLKDLVYEYKNKINKACVAYSQLDLSKSLENQYINDLHETFTQEFTGKKNIGIDFSDLLPHLQPASTLEVLAINGKSKDSLNYSKKEYPNGRSIIAIGGHSLSRGFTLEGLSVSYFTRNTKVSDTLLQMARWFGYRPNYGDLCRLFITSSAQTYYSQVTQTIEELNDEIREMERLGKSPKDFGLKVREHPGGLEVTARNKIGTGRHEMRYLSFWGQKYQKVRLYVDEESNSHNLQILKELIENIRSADTPERDEWTKAKGPFWTDVPSSEILSFVSNFRSPNSIRDELLVQFIERLHNSELYLKDWNVRIVSLQTKALKEFADLTLRPRTRSSGLKIAGNQLTFISSNIGDEVDDKDLLDKETVLQVQQYLKENNRKESSKVYLERLDKPTLMIHPLTIDKHEISHEPFTITYTVHFPRGKDSERDVKVSYLTNIIEREFEAQDIDDEEEDE